MKKVLLILGIAVVVIAIGVLSIGKTPQVNGEDVVFKTKDKEFISSEYYELLQTYYGEEYLYQRFEKDLLSSLDRSEQIKEIAASQVNELNTSIAQNADAQQNKENVILTLQSLGYSGFDEVQLYFENYLLRTEIIETYIYENIDTLYDIYVEQGNKPRYVSHILIKVEDTENVSEEEQAQLDSIKSRIENGEDFAVLAKEFSVDGSKEQGGSLGLMDRNSQFVEPFLEAALELESNEISEWVKSDYGFHLITVDTSDKETITKEASLNSMIYTGVSEIDAEVMKQLIKDSNVVFHDQELKNTIDSLLTKKGFQ